MMFDSYGNLILPKGTSEFFRDESKRLKRHGGERTGIIVNCPRCGHQWERTTRNGRARCSRCRRRIDLEALE